MATHALRLQSKLDLLKQGLVLAKAGFDPGQARDAHGRWAGGGAAVAAAPAAAAADGQSWVARHPLLTGYLGIGVSGALGALGLRMLARHQWGQLRRLAEAKQRLAEAKWRLSRTKSAVGEMRIKGDPGAPAPKNYEFSRYEHDEKGNKVAVFVPKPKPPEPGEFVQFAPESKLELTHREWMRMARGEPLETIIGPKRAKAWAAARAAEAKRRLLTNYKEMSPGFYASRSIDAKTLAAVQRHIGKPFEQFKKDFMGGVDGRLVLHDVVGDSRVYLQGDIRMHGQVVGTFERTINFASKEAYSASFFLAKEVMVNGQRLKIQGTGLGKKFLAGNVAEYRRLGMRRLKVTANGDVGGHAWARYGYVPTAESWLGAPHAGGLRRYLRGRANRLLNDGKMTLEEHNVMSKLLESDNPKAVWAVADSKHGKAMLLDSGWSGVMDFSDKETMRRFYDYVGGSSGSR